MTDTPPPTRPKAPSELRTTLLGMGLPIVAFLALGLSVSNCGGANDTTTTNEAIPAEAHPAVATGPKPTTITATKPAAPTFTAAERSMICRAGIAKVMGRDPATMKATSKAGGITAVQYRRPDDNKLWKSECKLAGDRIVWRGVDSFGNDGPGRWRDRPDDGTLTFALEGRRVTVTETYSDGSVVPEIFDFKVPA